MDNITHILCIKIWSNIMKIVATNNIITENIIKDRICNNEILGIKWSIKKWDNKMNNLILGDLTYNAHENICDHLIYKETENLIKSIEKELQENKILSLEQEIIFTIVVPIKKEIKKKGNIDSLFRMSFCEEKKLNLM